MPRGFLKTPTGIRAWVRVTSKRDGFNALATKRLPLTATVEQIREWRVAARGQLRAKLEAHRRKQAEITGGATSGFRYDAIHRYLPAVQAMPTYSERVRDILLWVDEFGDRDLHSIEAYEIRTVRDRWLTVGPKRKYQKVNGVGQRVDVAEPLAGSTVNHRLRALSNLWTVLYPHAPNPVREVPEADEPKELARAIDYDTIRKVFDAMPDRGPGLRGKKRDTHSLAKVCARVMAWTGITYKEVVQLQPDAIVWDRALVLVRPRRKGSGAPGRSVPLNVDALAALQDFDRLAIYDRVPTKGVILRAWQRACVEIIGRALRLHDIRHSFATGVVRATKDLKTAQLLLGHTNSSTTQRYAVAAMLPLLRAGIEAFSTSVTEKEKSNEHDAHGVLAKTARGNRGDPADVPRHRKRAAAAHKETSGDRAGVHEGVRDVAARNRSHVRRVRA
jgi:integrase